ncbi:hypothetical protein E4U37_008370, partial [Claviceps purpurea]
DKRGQSRLRSLDMDHNDSAVPIHVITTSFPLRNDDHVRLEDLPVLRVKEVSDLLIPDGSIQKLVADKYITGYISYVFEVQYSASRLFLELTEMI